MANQRARALFSALYALREVAHAIPAVAFPFNSQVPTVARVDKPYSFQLSESTFAPLTNDVVYTLVEQPAWLTFDGATRRLEGKPGQGDIGSENFVLVATDTTGTTSMPGTLVVSKDPAPILAGDISDQIAASANLSSRNPAVVTLLPSTTFQFDFERASFIDIVQRELYYYATLADHTPLPSWLIFDPKQLTFSGTSPDLSAFPQSWIIDLIASDVEGFAGSSASFTIAIAKQQLAFVPEQQDVNIIPGQDTDITSLKDQLFRNDQQLSTVELESARAELPSWLALNADTLAITGKTPMNVTQQNVTVSVVDKLGNSATATINLVAGNATFFEGEVGSIVARAGEHLSHQFADSLFTRKGVELSVTFPPSITWFQFDERTRTLEGEVPTSAKPTEIKATLLAKSPGGEAGETQIFTIEIKAARSTIPTSTQTSTTTTRTPSSTAPAAAVSSECSDRMAPGLIAVIVILCLLVAALLILAAWFCCRRRRRRQDIEHSPKKQNISRPMPSPDSNVIRGTAGVEGNAYGSMASEDGDTIQARRNDSAPQIGALNLPSQSGKRRSKFSNRFSKMSIASSMGMGDEVIRADANIPEWGQPSAALSAPHDSFVPAAEMAQMSRQLSDGTPSKRAPSRLYDRNRKSDALARTATGGMARHSSTRNARNRRTRSTLGLPTTAEGNSMASCSTRGTSMLSTQTTQASEFPRPPSASTSVNALLVVAAEKRRSIRNNTIRMVDQSEATHSDSVNDPRSFDEKRRSYLRKRKSKSGQNHFFAHGSRQSSVKGRQNGRSSILMSSMASMRCSQPMLPTYSESSSLEPTHHESKRFSQKVRAAFAPNYPRAMTRPTSRADDEQATGNMSSSNFTTTSEDINDDDEWIKDLPKPRNERNFVLPGEASPTPPPAPQHGSSLHTAEGENTRPPWKASLAKRSSSPLASHVHTSIMDRSSPLGSRKGKKSPRKGGPLSLLSGDSMHKTPKPKFARTNVQRPVSVEVDEVKRFSSMKAQQEQTTGGSEQWIDVDPDGLATQRSSWSGKAFMKFGKHIQKRQLDIPEYAASFVDYKALKKLIKKLSATPVLSALQKNGDGGAQQDSQTLLQANKATFFFRLERELEKVNIFYLQKEAELKLRLRTLLDKKKGLQSRGTTASKLSSSYVTLDEGFRLFSNDLDKLQQFVEVNQTAFSKILKKWDKTSKSRTKELYLSRAVDVQPCFNRDVISDLSDQATTGLLELQAWAEGEKIAYTPAVELQNRVQPVGQDDEIENQVIQAINAGNTTLVREWSARTAASEEAKERISRVFLNTANTAAQSAQDILYETNLVDFNYADPINERNCLHEAAVNGKVSILNVALTRGANIRAPDVYGRIPLHYACMHGRAEMVKILIASAPDTVDLKDLDNFTPLVHAIVHSRLESVQEMLKAGAIVDPTSSTDHIPLSLACQYGSVRIVEQILQCRPQIIPDAEGLFPQHLVARFGRDGKILVMLKEFGVDMDQPDKLYQWTPIFHAASEGHLHCLRQLLEFNVHAAAVDEKALPAMYYAAWEGHLDCMQLLAQACAAANNSQQSSIPAINGPPALTGMTPAAAIPELNDLDSEMIPDLSLPPPIIPLRRYGHNFLDTTKTFILLSFGDLGCDAIEFYGDTKYPAARLTISSKSSDLIPRNLPLPVQDDFKNISFQIENLEAFSIDFDIYPTFGSKVIARAAASSRVFTGKASSSGRWHLEMFDPRLRAIGRISFRYQVVTPFHGIPLEITHFATYWKATSQYDDHHSNLITGSSLSGDFMRLFVQVTRDGVPVLHNEWALPSSRNDLVSRLTYREFQAAGLDMGRGQGVLQNIVAAGIDREDLATTQRQVARSYVSLADTLALLPADLHLEIHVCYPSHAEEEKLQLGPTQNVNAVVDGVLKVVFDHARQLRESKDGPQRNFVFSSYNADICTALNWKQPNYPVLLCNELGVAPITNSQRRSSQNIVANCGRTDMSIKEAVRIAQSNNFMGLICTSRLLELVPALVSSVKEAGLVLIADYSHDFVRTRPASVLGLPKGADGLLVSNAVLSFKDTIEQ
ncbi:hypothetical protein TI39_contig614g00007 [Zymoseptoria brevis]|uniref:Ankyrin repeat protein nuc-2 n=1 Tax=Zymoseptoria brevis TaxID=1047168 RepID=A0A0F4GHQ6_9PEZI|nr:hypothetical protein TI39_contig614g00007 [Zymoseptoria brevis]